MTVVFASDHAGFRMREELAHYADSLGYDVLSVGASSEEPYDYPDAADAGCALITGGEAQMGIFVCGSGAGICIRANRHKGIRAASCLSVEMAKLARQHNHANVLCLGQRTIESALALEIVEVFLSEAEDAAERHVRRVAKIDGPLGV